MNHPFRQSILRSFESSIPITCGPSILLHRHHLTNRTRMMPSIGHVLFNVFPYKVKSEFYLVETCAATGSRPRRPGCSRRDSAVLLRLSQTHKLAFVTTITTYNQASVTSLKTGIWGDVLLMETIFSLLLPGFGTIFSINYN